MNRWPAGHAGKSTASGRSIRRFFSAGRTMRDLPLRDDPRDWMRVVHSACRDLLGRGYAQAYVILDDHPPIGRCHADFLRDIAAGHGARAWRHKRCHRRVRSAGATESGGHDLARLACRVSARRRAVEIAAPSGAVESRASGGNPPPSHRSSAGRRNTRLGLSSASEATRKKEACRGNGLRPAGGSTRCRLRCPRWPRCMIFRIDWRGSAGGSGGLRHAWSDEPPAPIPWVIRGSVRIRAFGAG